MQNEATETVLLAGAHCKKSGACKGLDVNKRFSNMHVLNTKFEVACWKGTLPCRLDLTKPNPVQWGKRDDGSLLSPATMTKEEYAQYLPLLFEGWALKLQCVHSIGLVFKERTDILLTAMKLDT